jgi:hypothetical protein
MGIPSGRHTTVFQPPFAEQFDGSGDGRASVSEPAENNAGWSFQANGFSLHMRQFRNG